MRTVCVSLVIITFLILSACKKTSEAVFELLYPSHTGIFFENLIIEKDSFNIMQNEYMYNGGGVGVGDLNNDGLQDLIFTGNKVLSRIYLNRGDFIFEDITHRFEGIDSTQWVSGVTVVDINNDGLLDIYLACTGSKDPALRRNQLWINHGIDEAGYPSFKNEASLYGIDDEGYSVHASFFDYDLDGHLDLYVLNNIVRQEIPTNYRPKIIDGSSINNDQLYRNQGNGTFINVTIEAGILYEGFGLGLAVSDINKDGYPDLYISNDYLSNDVLYINQQDGTFKNLIEPLLSYQSRFSMGNDVADINNDGLADIFTVDMLPEVYYRKKQTINGNTYLFHLNNNHFGYQHQYVRNMLHMHNGFIGGELLPFSEVGQLAGIYETEWSWSPLFFDIDNDGDKDLIISNGFPKDLTDKDFTNYKSKNYGYLSGDWDLIPKIPIVKVSNYIYENRGFLEFKNRSKEWGMNIPSFSNGAVFVDLNNDGYLDYVTNNINDPVFIFKNQLGTAADKNNFVRFRLIGEETNPMAIGSKVTIYAGGKMQYSELFLARGYVSSVEPYVHFGLSKVENIDSVLITWPDGLTSRILGLSVNTVHTLSYSELDKSRMSSSTPSNYTFQTITPPTYTHNQEEYVDFFQEQRIIQHMYSQIGPFMAIGDLTNDGVEELLVSGSASQPMQIFQLNDGTFNNLSIDGLSGLQTATQSGLLIVDIDNDGDNDIIAISGGYQHVNKDEYKQHIFINENGTFIKRELPIPGFIASVVIPIDFDKDGDMDLFIGARVERGQFPRSSPSYLLINENGQFSADRILSFDLGMVTDAVVSDYDNDGWPDLMVSRHWDNVTILHNEKGKLLKQQSLPSLDDKQGLWNTIVAIDIDDDGDDDYIIGNLGQNHRFTITDQYPLRVYAIDIDDNGVIDPIVSSYWRDIRGVMTEYPVNYLDELASQSPYFRKKFTSYTQFSYCTMDSILDRRAVSDSDIHFVNTTSSYLLVNEGNGKFKWMELPRELQTSPIKKMQLCPWPGSSVNNVLVCGNDHTYDASTGLYDANKGFILSFIDGKMKILSPQETGFIVNGQVEAIAKMNQGGIYLIGVNGRGISAFSVNNGNR